MTSLKEIDDQLAMMPKMMEAMGGEQAMKDMMKTQERRLPRFKATFMLDP